MTCLIIIAETKKTFSAFQFFHYFHYYNSSIISSNFSITGITAQQSWSQQYEPVTWKSQDYGNLLLHHCVLYEKTIVVGRKQPLRGARKQLFMNCKNVKTDNLQLENPWKILMMNF